MLGRVGSSLRGQRPAAVDARPRIAPLCPRFLYPRWDDAFAEELREMFAIDPKARVGDLSRGKGGGPVCWSPLPIGPICSSSTSHPPGSTHWRSATSWRPCCGPSPTKDARSTFSSHLLDEVERVSDHVALLDKGRVMVQGPLDDVRASHCVLTVQFDGPRPLPPQLAGMFGWEGGGREWSAISSLPRGEVQAAAQSWARASSRSGRRRWTASSCGLDGKRRRRRANPTGVDHIVPGASATQWYWGTNVDISTASPKLHPGRVANRGKRAPVAGCTPPPGWHPATGTPAPAAPQPKVRYVSLRDARTAPRQQNIASLAQSAERLHGKNPARIGVLTSENAR